MIGLLYESRTGLISATALPLPKPGPFRWNQVW